MNPYEHAENELSDFWRGYYVATALFRNELKRILDGKDEDIGVISKPLRKRLIDLVRGKTK